MTQPARDNQAQPAPGGRHGYKGEILIYIYFNNSKMSLFFENRCAVRHTGGMDNANKKVKNW